MDIQPFDMYCMKSNWLVTMTPYSPSLSTDTYEWSIALRSSKIALKSVTGSPINFTGVVVDVDVAGRVVSIPLLCELHEFNEISTMPIVKQRIGFSHFGK